MKLFNRDKPSVCETCGVYFKAANGPFGISHCAEHRKPLVDLHYRRAAVMLWAEANWKRLEDQMIKEREESSKNLASRANALGQAMAAGCASQYQGGALSGLGSMFGASSQLGPFQQ